jgi:hypothetical protein
MSGMATTCNPGDLGGEVGSWRQVGEEVSLARECTWSDLQARNAVVVVERSLGCCLRWSDGPLDYVWEVCTYLSSDCVLMWFLGSPNRSQYRQCYLEQNNRMIPSLHLFLPEPIGLVLLIARFKSSMTIREAAVR